MKPLFTIHEGEFLVGDYINRRLGKKFETWVPTKDSGLDLLVTRKNGRGRPCSLQVKFSRGFNVHESLAGDLKATSWYTLDPKKVRTSRADIWVFVILTLRHEEHFVVIPTRELAKRIPRGTRAKWHLYLSVYRDKSCFQVRNLGLKERRLLAFRGAEDRRVDFTHCLGNWSLLSKFTG
jgi:hypothetical protein